MVQARLDVVQHDGGRVVQLRQARTHAGRPVYWVSSYWVDGALIDVGPAHARERLLPWLTPRRLDAVWVTHHHEDHVGSLGPLQASRGVAAYASARTQERIPGLATIPWYRRHAWGLPAPGRLEDAPRSFSTQHHRFDVVETPGHTTGDLSFVEPAERWAFSGDIFLGLRQVVARPREDLCATMRSLERILVYEPRVLFTGIRVFPNASQVLRERLAFLKQVLRDLDEARHKGLSPGRARRRVVGREGFIHYWSRGDFAKQHFVDQAYRCLGEGERRRLNSANLGTTG